MKRTAAKDGLPDGWNGWFFQPTAGYHLQIVNEAHTGKKSLLLEGSGQFGVIRANRLPLDRTQRYRGQAWIKIEGKGNVAADVKFHYYRADGSYIDQTRTVHITPRSTGWHKLTVVDQQEQFPDATEIELAVALAGATKATAWFDDLQLTTEPLKPAGEVNLVPNGDMEDVLDGRPSAWGIYVAEGGEVEGSIDADVHHGGERSLHLVGKGEWIAAGSPRIRLDRRKQYQATVFAKAKHGAPKLTIGYLADGKFLGKTDSEKQIAGDDWQQISVKAEADKFPEATHLSIICGGLESLDAWFDDLNVVWIAP